MSAALGQKLPSGFSMDFDPARRVLRVSFHEIVSDQTMMQAGAAVRQFLDEEGADFGIFDYSGLTGFTVTPEYVRTAATNKPAARPMKLLIAVAPQTEVYAMNRMYELLIEGKRAMDFQVVRTMREAETCIGLGTLNFSRAL
jgi:hypothetical protein